jgi:peroxiredoxin
LCQHKDEFKRLDTEIMVVSFGLPAFASRWLDETCDWFRLLIDPERAVYQAYGLESSLVRSWNLKTVARYIELMRQGREWRGIQGDSTQLGGDFIVDRNGTVRLAYRSHDPTDRPSVSELLIVLRQLSDQGED